MKEFYWKYHMGIFWKYIITRINKCITLRGRDLKNIFYPKMNCREEICGIGVKNKNCNLEIDKQIHFLHLSLKCYYWWVVSQKALQSSLHTPSSSQIHPVQYQRSRKSKIIWTRISIFVFLSKILGLHSKGFNTLFNRFTPYINKYWHK